MRDLVRGNVLWLSVISLLNDAASEMIYPLLPFFVVGTLGAGPAVLGIIEGVAETTASFAKLASGWMSDRAGRRKPWIVAGYAVAAVVRPLIAIVTQAWQLVAIRFTDRLGKGLRSAPRDALLAGSVGAERRGTAFGVHRAADHAGAVLGPLIASGLLLLWPGELRLVFALALIPGLMCVAVAVFAVREAVPEALSHRPGSGAILHAGGTPPRVDVGLTAERGIRARPGFRRYLIVLMLFTLGNASDAFLLLRAQQLGVALPLIPLLWGALHVSKSFWNVVGGVVADRFGPRRAIVAGWILYAAVYAGFAIGSEPWHAWALFLVYGLYYGLTEAPEKSLVAAFAPQEKRGLAFGSYHFAIGIAALPASILFGAIWQQLGAPTAFYFGAGLALLAALLLPLTVRGPRVASAGAS